MDERPNAFVLMPFDDEFNSIFERVIKVSLEDAGYQVARADSFLDQHNILKSIIHGIRTADLIVADLTTSNANVFYELGLCHGLGIPTVLLAQAMDEVPFDLRSYKVQIYQTHFDQIQRLKDSLRTIGEKHKRKEISFGNPMMDFSPDPFDKRFDTESEKVNLAPGEDQEEKGLWDYLAEGEEATARLTSILEGFQKENEAIAERLNKHTNNIQSVASNPGPGSAGRFHKISLLAAADINTFSKNVESVLPEFEATIEQLNENYTGWISLAQLKTEEDREQLNTFQATIEKLLEGTQEANTSVQAYRDTVLEMHEQRISKDLNRATRRQALALEGVIANVQKVEAFCIKTLTVLKERFG